MEIVFEAKNITVGYGNEPVVRDVSFAVEPGEILTMIGPNGAGKTTLLRAAAGFLLPMDGAMYLEGKRLLAYAPAERAKRLSVCFTERTDAGKMRCGEVVEMGRYPYTGRFGLLGEDDHRAVSEAMELVGVADLADAPFAKISDGQRQLVLLARAVAQRPKVLILDEPTSYLDISHKLRFVEVLRRLSQREHIAVITSMHELELARALSDRVIGLSKDGEAVGIGTPGELFSDGFFGALFGVAAGKLKELYGAFAETLSRE